MGFWDALAKIALAIVFIYLVLRVLGVLNSPAIADIIAIFSAAYFVARYAAKIDIISEDIKELKKECPIFGKRK